MQYVSNFNIFLFMNVSALQLRNIASNLCVDTRFRNQPERFGLEKCIKDEHGAGGEQVLIHFYVSN